MGLGTLSSYLLGGLNRSMLIRCVWKAVRGHAAISFRLVGLNRSTLIACGDWKGSCQSAEQDPGHYSTPHQPPSRCVGQVSAIFFRSGHLAQLAGHAGLRVGRLSLLVRYAPI